MDDEPSYLEQLPDSAVERILSGTGSGLFIGGIVGSIFSNWQTLPQHIAARPMAALGATGACIQALKFTQLCAKDELAQQVHHCRLAHRPALIGIQPAVQAASATADGINSTWPA